MYDNHTGNGYGPDEFFKNNYVGQTRSQYSEEELIKAFTFSLDDYPATVSLAPYRFDKFQEGGQKTTVHTILGAAAKHSLLPSLTLGHMDNIIQRFASPATSEYPLYEGSGGNVFPIVDDVNGNMWFIWIFLHIEVGSTSLPTLVKTIALLTLIVKTLAYDCSHPSHSIKINPVRK